MTRLQAIRIHHFADIAAACSATVLAVLILNSPALANAPEDKLGGQMRAEADGRAVYLPALKTEITANVKGDMAAVEVVQTFINPGQTPLNATYLFPLDKDAAVHAMQMLVGDELIQAKIARREAARQTFETAKQAGKSAALLEQHRPNMFTQSVANLMPGQPIKVTLKYVQMVPRIEGAYELVVPLVVGPRYIPAASGAPVAQTVAEHPGATAPAQDETGSGPHIEARSGQWTLGPVPAYPPVAGLTIPKLIDPDRVSITVNLEAGIPLTSILSTTHAIDVNGEGQRRTVTLRDGRTIENRDFVLAYRIAAGSIQAGALTHRDASGGTLSLMIEPPALAEADRVTPREIVFLLDTSGSMSGLPIKASKVFMRHALKALRPTDYFRIIRFSNNASEFTSAPVRATPDNLARGQAYVDGLQANGGTEVIAGLTQTFGMQQTAGTRRMLVFLSDGYVGNEADILRMVAANIGQARTYTLGVGTAVNRYLLAEMAHQGRGFTRVIDPTEKTEDAAIAFANKLSTTVMIDLSIDWGGLEVSDQVPAALPDLFAGDSIRVSARFAASGTHTLRIKGRINGREATLPLTIELPAEATGEATRAIPLTWARGMIKDQMRQIMTPVHLRQPAASDGAIEERVTALGLAHSLVTQWTSFVAVSETVANPNPGSAQDADVPLPMVKGVGPKAYGQQPGLQHAMAGPGHTRVAGAPAITTSSFGTFAGGSTPEPEHLIGLLVVLATLLAGWMARRPA